MRKLRSIAIGITLMVLVFSLAGPILRMSRVRAESGDWISMADALVTKTVDLPANTNPTRGNIDCHKGQYLTTMDTRAEGCFVSSGIGQMDASGAAILMHESALGIPITSRAVGQFGTTPIPNQQTVLSQSSAPIMGSYLYFYPNLYSAMTLHTDLLDHRWYTIDAEPRIQLVDPTTKQPIATNAYGTLSFSSNGQWLTVDAPDDSFMRVDLTNYTIMRFAPSQNSGLDYTLKSALTSVSDDGKYVAVVSPSYHYFRVYNLANCGGLTKNSNGLPVACPSRDYWPYVASKLNGLAYITSVRFNNDENINFDAVYNFASSSRYDAARFTLTAPGGQAHSIDYLALGDSYISGQGTFQYKPETDTTSNACHVSKSAYPYIVGAATVNSYESVACSGAKIKDITGIYDYNHQKNGAQSRGMSDAIYDDQIYSNFLTGYRPQLDFIKKYQPRVVTVSVGGNDIGFADIMESCVAPHLSLNQTCFNSYSERQSLMTTINSIYGMLQRTYESIINADPGVQLYVIGYPQIAMPGNCANNVHLDPSEITFSQQMINDLDDTIQKASESAGARYVDTQHALDGHRLCETDSRDVAINGITAGKDGGFLGLKIFGSESFHPNALGHRLLAQAVMQATDKFGQPMPKADSSITPTPVNDPSVQPIFNGYQNSGAKIDAAIYGEMLPDFAVKGSTSQISISNSQISLQPGGNYSVGFQAGSNDLGSVSADTDGNLVGQITIPTGTAPGFYTIHVYGKDAAGQQIDIYRVIYIAASNDDYDGDGISNSENTCLALPLSGKDIDGDGVDDACDPQIGEEIDYGHQYPAIVKLTENSVQAQHSN